MKFQIHFSHPFHLGLLRPKVAAYATSAFDSDISKTPNKISLKKMKSNINKLLPLHWYDGVWDNLDFKM